MEPLNIGLIGCGTVGGGVAKLLLEQPERLAARAGRPLVLRRVVVRNPDKPRAVRLPREIVTTDLQQVLRDPSIQVAVEVVGGVDWARQAVLALLAAGKDVVTANKALLAQHGAEVFDAARRHGRAVAFEASVAGGVPIIAALAQSLAANQILSLQGILNGTSNFILTGMTEHGQSYADALAEAQRRGYAEADPTLDVDGTDAAHKLAILAQIAFGVAVPVTAIERRGIAEVEAARHSLRPRAGLHHQAAGRGVAGRTTSWRCTSRRCCCAGRRRWPRCAAPTTPSPSSATRSATRSITDRAQGRCRRPAPWRPTSSTWPSAAAQRTFQTLRLWSPTARGTQLRPPATVRSRFYLRLLVDDRPGVLAEVARVLAQHQISIASVIQHEAPDDLEGVRVQLVIMTHTAATGAFRAAAAEMERLGCVASPAVYYPVGD